MNAHQGPLAFHQKVELLQDFRRNPPLDVVFLQPAGDKKSPHRAQSQAEGGVQQAQGRPEQVAADETGGLPGDGGEDHLEGLDHDEHQGRQGPRVLEDGLDPVLVGTEAELYCTPGPTGSCGSERPRTTTPGREGPEPAVPRAKAGSSARKSRSLLQSLIRELLIHHQPCTLRYRKASEMLFG